MLQATLAHYPLLYACHFGTPSERLPSHTACTVGSHRPVLQACHLSSASADAVAAAAAGRPLAQRSILGGLLPGEWVEACPGRISGWVSSVQRTTAHACDCSLPAMLAKIWLLGQACQTRGCKLLHMPTVLHGWHTARPQSRCCTFWRVTDQTSWQRP